MGLIQFAKYQMRFLTRRWKRGILPNESVSNFLRRISMSPAKGNWLVRRDMIQLLACEGTDKPEMSTRVSSMVRFHDMLTPAFLPMGVETKLDVVVDTVDVWVVWVILAKIVPFLAQIDDFSRYIRDKILATTSRDGAARTCTKDSLEGSSTF